MIFANRDSNFFREISQTLVQPPDQSIRRRWMKIGNRLPIATPYGRFFEKFKNSNFFPEK